MWTFSYRPPPLENGGFGGQKSTNLIYVPSLKDAAIGAAAVRGAVAAVPAALGAIGFTSAGVAVGSIAAWFQPAAVASGSVFAWCQSVGAAGFAWSTYFGAAGVGAAANAVRR